VHVIREKLQYSNRGAGGQEKRAKLPVFLDQTHALHSPLQFYAGRILNVPTLDSRPPLRPIVLFDGRGKLTVIEVPYILKNLIIFTNFTE
jgi:hypothetical protein